MKKTPGMQKMALLYYLRKARKITRKLGWESVNFELDSIYDEVKNGPVDLDKTNSTD